MKNRYCRLKFDKIVLKRRLFYDVTVGEVAGYEDIGTHAERTSNLNDHALVLMLQGIKGKFKQPLAFYFVKGTTFSQRLSAIIEEIILIRAKDESGFKG